MPWGSSKFFLSIYYFSLPDEGGENRIYQCLRFSVYFWKFWLRQGGLSFYGSQKGDEGADTMFQFCLPNGCSLLSGRWWNGITDTLSAMILGLSDVFLPVLRVIMLFNKVFDVISYLSHHSFYRFALNKTTRKHWSDLCNLTNMVSVELFIANVSYWYEVLQAASVKPPRPPSAIC